MSQTIQNVALRVNNASSRQPQTPNTKPETPNLILFPNCKINLGLSILRKREDGFHDLETVFYPIPLQDALEVIHHPSPLADIAFSASGLKVEGNTSDNSCIKAYQLLQKDFPQLPPIKMHLHKTIPMGAGLGGGSADGAFALLLLNKKFNLGIEQEQLIRYALQLGSDCPFFIRNTPCYATGRGEVMEEIKLDLTPYQFVLVNPGIHVNTGWAFSQITPATDRQSLKNTIQLPVEEWKTQLVNDFEEPVSKHHPEITVIKQSFYQQGAVYASMTGSGSTVFGIFPKDATPAFSFPAHYFVKIV
jgi:4-diphosphocytidyl-2-C-methyl-D-erythritol kinase